MVVGAAVIGLNILHIVTPPSKPWVEQGVRLTQTGNEYVHVNWYKVYNTLRTVQASCCNMFAGIAENIKSEMMVLDWTNTTGTSLAYRYSNGTGHRPTTFYITGIGPY